MIKLRIFPDAATLHHRTAEELLNLFTTGTGALRGIMLSGGSTPASIYELIRRNPSPCNPNLRLFLSDERMVPPDSDSSNSRLIRPMLEAIGAGPENVFAPDTALPAAEAATRFGAAVETALKQGMTVPLGLLGIGADGHTAGLFTPEQAQETGRAAVAVQRPDGMTGISLTPRIFRQIGKIVILATGESKKNMLQILRHNPLSIPAGIALRNHPDVEIRTDIQIED